LIPDPLHPAVVHFPIVLSVLVPVFAVAAAFAIHRRRIAPRAWGLVVLLQAALAVSAWVATETGENEEERVERVVAESFIEEHEELGARFFWLSVATLVVVAAGVLAGRAGVAARVVGSVATLAVLAVSVFVGHSGGELVYRHGAAAAYVSPPGSASVSPGGPGGEASHPR
jgi:uncharacterized membrane protein